MWHEIKFKLFVYKHKILKYELLRLLEHEIAKYGIKYLSNENIKNLARAMQVT